LVDSHFLLRLLGGDSLGGKTLDDPGWDVVAIGRKDKSW